MTFQGTNTVRPLRSWTLLTLLSIALGFGMAGCTEEEPERTEVGSAYEALATQLQNCASNGLDCYQAANCDETAEQACRDDFRVCREATRDAYRTYHEAVRGCFRAKIECVTNAFSDGGALTGDAGSDAFGACRDEFHACIETDRPIPAEPGPCMAGLRECVQTNVQWGEDGSRGAFHDCLSDAHSCIVNRLPMCEPEAGTGGPIDAGPAGAGGAGGMGGVGGVRGAVDAGGV